MENKQIIFTAPNLAELLDVEIPDEIKPNQVLVRTVYTAVSAGTERANLIGEENICGVKSKCNTNFPRRLGYSGVGIVEKIGEAVKSVKVGERVVIYFGKHQKYNLMNERNVYPIGYDSVTDEEAALCTIACFPIEGLRKTRLEIGESALVMGLGILGLIGVQMCRAAGAAPVIAADPNPARRELALKCGATDVLDPLDPDFSSKVKALTGGKGADVIIEVSGVGSALQTSLECVARFGRISLLGCTRKNIDDFDVYHMVHYPGISIVGAHNDARPKFESRPGNWTAYDDLGAIIKLLASGSLNFKPLINEIHKPEECKEQFERLAFDYANFPIGLLFDWRD